jgi:hypothetical protein
MLLAGISLQTVDYAVLHCPGSERTREERLAPEFLQFGREMLPAARVGKSA